MIGVAALGFRTSQNTHIHVELVEWEIGNTWRGIGRMQKGILNPVKHLIWNVLQN